MFSSPDDWESDSGSEEVEKFLSPRAQWHEPGADGVRFALHEGFPAERESRHTTKWALRAMAGVVGPEDHDIAHCGASLICPDLMSNRAVDYKAIAKSAEEGLRQAMHVLFSRRDFRLKESFKSGGIWGSDYEDSWIVCFERLAVDESARRKGLGTKMVVRMMEEIMSRARKVQKPVMFIVLAAPPERELREKAAGRSMAQKEQIQRASLRATRHFWRSLGFVRMGETLYFGWTRQISSDLRKRVDVRSEDLAEDEAKDQRQGHLARLVGLRY